MNCESNELRVSMNCKSKHVFNAKSNKTFEQYFEQKQDS